MSDVSSDFHIPLPSIVPFAHSHFIHGCIYSIFPGSLGTASFFPSFRFPVTHNFWESHWVHSVDMIIKFKIKEYNLHTKCFKFTLPSYLKLIL